MNEMHEFVKCESYGMKLHNKNFVHVIQQQLQLKQVSLAIYTHTQW